MKIHIVGLGLIGSSIAASLGNKGHTISGTDASSEHEAKALNRGVIHSTALDADTDFVFICVPVDQSVKKIQESLDLCDGFVSDVGSTKARVCDAITNPRFIGGHPMAGSEKQGIDGSSSDLFTGATWVATPTAFTGSEAQLMLHQLVSEMGAQLVTVDPSEHDRMVASVSHVPHLASVSLMNVALSSTGNSDLLLSLAAGGFRDMTRISGGTVDIWPDICRTNSSAIVEGLQRLSSEILEIADDVRANDTESLRARLSSARTARRNLPQGFAKPSEVVEVQVTIADEPGQLAEVTKLAFELGVNLLDLSIEHLTTGDAGRLMMAVAKGDAETISHGLTLAGYETRIDSYDE